MFEIAESHSRIMLRKLGKLSVLLLIGQSMVSGFQVINHHPVHAETSHVVDKLIGKMDFQRMHCKPYQEIAVDLNGKKVMVPCHVNNELAKCFAPENDPKKVAF